MWRRIAVVLVAAMACVVLRFEVMGWATPGTTAFSQFDNPVAHMENRWHRQLTGVYLAARHMWLLFWPVARSI